MHRRAALGAALVLGLSGLLAPMGAAHAAAPRRVSATPDASVGPLISGESAYVDGTYAWTDYAYDDTGANTDGTPGGDTTYPSSVARGNAADLVQLQLRFVDGGALQIRAVLETLLDKKVPVIKVELRAGDGVLPVTMKSGTADVDPRANTITAVVPANALPALRGVMQVKASVGLASTGQVYDLAFVHAEDPTTSGGALASAEQVSVTGMGHATGGEWQDKRQADVIAGLADAKVAVGTVDLDVMRAKRTLLPDARAGGYHTWLYHSDLALGEGIVDGTAAGGLWAGPYQPYLVQVPPQLVAPAPLVLYLHGGGQGHLDNGMFAPQGGLSLGRSIGVFPYGREVTTGQDHGYQGASEQDVLDVLADVQRGYPIDPRRVLSAGTSTGGGGAFRIAQLHPDRFTAVLPLSAYDDTHLIENLTNTIVWMHNGIADPAANQAVLAGTMREFDALGTVDYRSWSVLAHTHADEVAPLTQCLLDGFAARPAVTNPARVVYTIDPNNELVDARTGVDVRHRGAYWLSGIGLRDGVVANGPADGGSVVPGYGNNAAARVEAVSLAMPVRTTVATPVERMDENASHGADYCADPATSQSNDVWREHGLALSPGRAQRTTNGLAVSLASVTGAAFDLVRMGIDVGDHMTVAVTSDGRVSLVLNGPWREGQRVRVWRDGREQKQLRAHDGRLVLRATGTGTHQYHLAPV